MSHKKVSIYNEYINYHNHYTNKIGGQVFVAMQVGMFYESYATNEYGPDLNIISDILNIVKTKKNGSIEKVNESNPYLLGFPVSTIDKFVRILMNNGYHVVVIDQVKDPKSDSVSRKVTNIVSPSTFIDVSDSSSKGLVIFYVEYNKSITTNKSICSVGMCYIDISIGTVIYYESHAESLVSESNAFDESQKFYHHYRPSELIIYEPDNMKSISEFIDVLPNQVMFKFNKLNNNFEKPVYQNEILKKVYGECALVSPIEYYNLSKHPISIIALIIGFDYIHQHNEDITKKLNPPDFFDNHTFMVLHNGAQYQLNIIGNKYDSLYGILNNCLTPMGKRMLKQRLCMPYLDKLIICDLYDLSEKVQNMGVLEKLRANLSCICDMEKIIRKINIGKVSPYELFNLHVSLTSSEKLFIDLKNTDFHNSDVKKQLDICVQSLDNTFIINSLKDSDFFRPGIHSDIDELKNKIKTNTNICDFFVKAFGDPTIQVKHNDTDGYYLSTTLKKGGILKNRLESMSCDLKVTDDLSIKTSDFVFSSNKTVTKISCDYLKNHSKNIDKLKDEFDELTKKYFMSDVINWLNQYIETINQVIKIVTKIDYVCNNVFTSIKYHYSRPKIVEGESFIEAKELRHPIVERTISKEYIPHDVSINSDRIGYLIYGTNGCGKSILMKAIGLNLIMAQCGLFVPSRNFKYGLFDSLFTRITGNDNMLKGESTFILEMKELKRIIHSATDKSLVIGDEVCRGTEYLSGNAIVASTILRFSKSKIKFLFATHLHDMTSFNKIKDLTNVYFCHISMEEKDGELIFNRLLKNGTGEQVYGIKIAKHILNDPYFIEDAIDFQNELLIKSGTNPMLVNDKKSLYNGNIYMDQCVMCKSKLKLESHHIIHQKDFDEEGFTNQKFHVLKNDQSNIMVLCTKCHDKIHKE